MNTEHWTVFRIRSRINQNNRGKVLRCQNYNQTPSYAWKLHAPFWISRNSCTQLKDLSTIQIYDSNSPNDLENPLEKLS